MEMWESLTTLLNKKIQGQMEDMGYSSGWEDQWGVAPYSVQGNTNLIKMLLVFFV